MSETSSPAIANAVRRRRPDRVAQSVGPAAGTDRPCAPAPTGWYWVSGPEIPAPFYASAAAPAWHVDPPTLTLQPVAHLATTVERMTGVFLINEPHQLQVLRRLRPCRRPTVLDPTARRPRAQRPVSRPAVVHQWRRGLDLVGCAGDQDKLAGALLTMGTTPVIGVAKSAHRLHKIPPVGCLPFAQWI